MRGIVCATQGRQLLHLLPSFAGEVSPSYGDDGGVRGHGPAAHDPSVRDDADTSPAKLGRNAYAEIVR